MFKLKEIIKTPKINVISVLLDKQQAFGLYSEIIVRSVEIRDGSLFCLKILVSRRVQEYITEKGYLTLVRYPFNFSQPLCGLRAVRG